MVSLRTHCTHNISIMSKLHTLPKISLSQTPKLPDSQLFMHHIRQYACRQGVKHPNKTRKLRKTPLHKRLTVRFVGGQRTPWQLSVWLVKRVLGWVLRQLHQGRCRGCTGGHVCLFTHPQSGSSILNVLHRHMILLLHCCCLSKTPTLPGAMIYNKHKSSSHCQPMQSHTFSVHYLPFPGLFTEQGPAAYTDMLSHWIINYKLDFEML